MPFAHDGWNADLVAGPPAATVDHKLETMC